MHAVMNANANIWDSAVIQIFMLAAGSDKLSQWWNYELLKHD